VGVILYMFLVGLDLDTKLLRQRTHTLVAISHASIIAPFLLGAALALWLYPLLSSRDVSFTVFALFMGVSMSVTAFPVLARILTDRQMHKTRLGTIALACAAVGDVTAWCLLALVVSMSEFGDWRSAITHLPGVVAENLNHYAIFAAFLAGALWPNKASLGGVLHDRLAGVLSLLFLPVFFAFSGIRTQIGLVSGANWGLCAAILAVACVGKFGGSVTAARFTGIGWRDAAALGVLMNTRGLVELVVLNIGLDLGVLSPTLFTMLVIMALVTTFMTSPLLQLLLRANPWTVDVRLKPDATTVA
jgi:Kef-type K+ transport system membrane component KefB